MNDLGGIYQGTVVNNVDPQSSGRLLLTVPAVTGYNQTTWAVPSSPSGIPAVPATGTAVWVQFIGGDRNRPVWVGIPTQVGLDPSGTPETFNYLHVGPDEAPASFIAPGQLTVGSRTRFYSSGDYGSWWSDNVRLSDDFLSFIAGNDSNSPSGIVALQQGGLHYFPTPLKTPPLKTGATVDKDYTASVKKGDTLDLPATAFALGGTNNTVPTMSVQAAVPWPTEGTPNNRLVEWKDVGGTVRTTLYADGRLDNSNNITIPANTYFLAGTNGNPPSILMKYSAPLDSGVIDTWGNAKPIRIGGSSVTFKAESNASVNVTVTGIFTTNSTSTLGGTTTIGSGTGNSDVQLNSSSRPTLYTTQTNVGLQIRSNGTGLLQLNSDNAGGVSIAGGGGDTNVWGRLYVNSNNIQVTKTNGGLLASDGTYVGYHVIASGAGSFHPSSVAGDVVVAGNVNTQGVILAPGPTTTGYLRVGAAGVTLGGTFTTTGAASFPSAGTPTTFLAQDAANEGGEIVLAAPQPSGTNNLQTRIDNYANTTRIFQGGTVAMSLNMANGNVSFGGGTGTVTSGPLTVQGNGVTVQFGGSALQGYYADVSNLALRTPVGNNVIYFQGYNGGGINATYNTSNGILNVGSVNGSGTSQPSYFATTAGSNNGPISVAYNGVTADNNSYGIVGVTATAATNTAYYSMTAAGQMVMGIGMDSGNRMRLGNVGVGKVMNNVSMAIDSSGNAFLGYGINTTSTQGYFLIDNGTGVVGGFGKRMLLSSYHGIEVRGAHVATAVSPATGGATADAGFTVYSPGTGQVAQVVQGVSGQSSDLTQWQTDTGLSVAAVQSDGSIYARGTTNGNGYVKLNPGTTANAGYVSFFQPNGTRAGYIGWNNAAATSQDQGYINYNAATHYFGGTRSDFGVVAIVPATGQTANPFYIQVNGSSAPQFAVGAGGYVTMNGLTTNADSAVGSKATATSGNPAPGSYGLFFNNTYWNGSVSVTNAPYLQGNSATPSGQRYLDVFNADIFRTANYITAHAFTNAYMTRIGEIVGLAGMYTPYNTQCFYVETGNGGGWTWRVSNNTKMTLDQSGNLAAQGALTLQAGITVGGGATGYHGSSDWFNQSNQSGAPPTSFNTLENRISGFYCGASMTDTPDGLNDSNWWNILQLRHQNVSNNYGFQLASKMTGYTLGKNLYFRPFSGGNGTDAGVPGGSWVRILTTADSDDTAILGMMGAF